MYTLYQLGYIPRSSSQLSSVWTFVLGISLDNDLVKTVLGGHRQAVALSFIPRRQDDGHMEEVRELVSTRDAWFSVVLQRLASHYALCCIVRKVTRNQGWSPTFLSTPYHMVGFLGMTAFLPPAQSGCLDILCWAPGSWSSFVDFAVCNSCTGFTFWTKHL